MTLRSATNDGVSDTHSRDVCASHGETGTVTLPALAGVHVIMVTVDAYNNYNNQRRRFC